VTGVEVPESHRLQKSPPYYDVNLHELFKIVARVGGYEAVKQTRGLQSRIAEKLVPGKNLGPTRLLGQHVKANKLIDRKKSRKGKNVISIWTIYGLSQLEKLLQGETLGQTAEAAGGAEP